MVLKNDRFWIRGVTLTVKITIWFYTESFIPLQTMSKNLLVRFSTLPLFAQNQEAKWAASVVSLNYCSKMLTENVYCFVRESLPFSPINFI